VVLDTPSPLIVGIPLLGFIPAYIPTFMAFVVTMPVSLPELENDVIFSKRKDCIQSEVWPRKSSYRFWGSAISSPV